MIERETKRNIEVMWLVNRVSPTYKTIADFRRDHAQAIVGVYREFIGFCRRQQLFGGELLAIDGTRIEAAASGQPPAGRDAQTPGRWLCLTRLLVRGQKNWDIHPDVYPVEGEYVLDKAGKGAFGSSTLHMYLKNLSITHIIITGVTTEVCVHTIMREANDYGYWCTLLKDCTGATDRGNYEAAIKSIKMEGGVFGNVSDKKKFIDAVNKQLR